MKNNTNLSPNFSNTIRSKKQIKFVIIHYTGMQSQIVSIKRLTDPSSKVSCHYLIDKKGKIIQLVSEKNIAWHAGKSKWFDQNNLNLNSIGIELENKGHDHGYENFPKLQINSLIGLCKKLKKEYKIRTEHFLGHSDIAPLRKIDPGEKFPWKKLSKFNLGKWYKERSLNINNLSKKNVEYLFFKNLHKLGYRYFEIEKRSKNDKFIIKAFQRRYLPKKVSGVIDKKTLKISIFLTSD